MSLVFLDSFDGYASAETPLRWRLGGGNIISGGRTNKGLSQGATTVVPYNANWVCGFAAYFGNDQAVGAIYIGSTPGIGSLIELYIESDLSVSVYSNGTRLANSSGTVILALANSWNYFEIKYSVIQMTNTNSPPQDTLGVTDIQVRVNKQTVIPLITAPFNTDVLIANTLTNQAMINVHALTVSNGDRQGIIFDDFYLFNQDGTTNNDFAGDVKIYVVVPISTTYSQFLSSNSGSTADQWNLIDEIPPDGDVSYIFDNTNSDFANFLYQPIAPFTGEIVAVQYSVFVRKDDEGSRAFQMTAGGSTSPGYVGPVIYVGDSYVYYMLPLDTVPGGGAWTVAVFNATSFGLYIYTIPVPS